MIYAMILCDNYMAAYSEEAIHFYHVETGKRSSLPSISTSRVSAMSYISTLRWLISTHTDGRICVWSIDSGELVFEHSEYSFDLAEVASSPDGKSFITIDNDQVYIWSMRPFQEQDTVELSWEPRRVLYLSSEEVILTDLMNDLHLYNVKDKTKDLLPLNLPKGMVYDVAYASKRQELYVFTGFNIIRYSLAQNQILNYFLDIEEEPPLYNHYPSTGVLLPDQNILISADFESNHILILDAITGAVQTTLVTPEQGIRRIEVSPDGQILFTLRKFIRAWDLETQKEIYQILP